MKIHNVERLKVVESSELIICKDDTKMWHFLVKSVSSNVEILINFFLKKLNNWNAIKIRILILSLLKISFDRIAIYQNKRYNKITYARQGLKIVTIPISLLETLQRTDILNNCYEGSKFLSISVSITAHRISDINSHIILRIHFFIFSVPYWS